jgi:hypothetical protein
MKNYKIKKFIAPLLYIQIASVFICIIGVIFGGKIFGFFGVILLLLFCIPGFIVVLKTYNERKNVVIIDTIGITLFPYDHRKYLIKWENIVNASFQPVVYPKNSPLVIPYLALWISTEEHLSNTTTFNSIDKFIFLKQDAQKFKGQQFADLYINCTNMNENDKDFPTFLKQHTNIVECTPLVNTKNNEEYEQIIDKFGNLKN